MDYGYTLPDLARECRLAAKSHRACPDCGGRWLVRNADSGVHLVTGGNTYLYVALACRKCKAHDATTVAI